jgi:hypothetical protein
MATYEMVEEPNKAAIKAAYQWMLNEVGVWYDAVDDWRGECAKFYHATTRENAPVPKHRLALPKIELQAPPSPIFRLGPRAYHTFHCVQRHEYGLALKRMGESWELTLIDYPLLPSRYLPTWQITTDRE